MNKKRTGKIIVILLGLMLICPWIFAEGVSKDVPSVFGVTAITKVIGDGQKVAAIAVEYSEAIDSRSLELNDFSVPDRTITDVYVNGEASTIKNGSKGKYVIIELETAVVSETDTPAGPGPGEESAEGETGAPDGEGFAGPQLGAPSDKPATEVVLTSEITQTGDVSTVTGAVIPASDTLLTSDTTINPVVDDFQQLVFQDPANNGKSLMYNLYIPENYDPDKKYPLVLFMHDAGVVSNNPIETLTQGLGAVIWATPEEQAKHESFVLAPQYNCVIADDNSRTSVEMDMTVNLIYSLMDKYSIDPDRLYNTGQSMGGMTSIAMDIKYPDLFAASWLVACQWDPESVSPVADIPLWIVVSQGDSKAKPGMDAITAVLQTEGAAISKAVWNAEAAPDVLNQNVESQLKENSSINYTVFEGGNHRYTWQYAYSIEGIRDWLYRQHK